MFKHAISSPDVWFHAYRMPERIGVCVIMFGSLLEGHKSLELSRELVLRSPSVSVCRGEVFYTDDRENEGR